MLAPGPHLWADRFDGALEDIFGLQDQVTTSVVGALAPRLEQAEIQRAKHKPTESLDAYDYFLRGMANFYRSTNAANSEALRLFYKAVDLDPEFASAHAMAAWCYTWRKINGWMADRTEEIAEGTRLATSRRKIDGPRQCGRIARNRENCNVEQIFARHPARGSIDRGRGL